MTVKLLNPGTGGYYRFQSWFADAWKQAIGEVVPDTKLPHKLRALGGRCISWSRGRHEENLVVCGCHHVESCAWPWLYRYNIIPMMWDLWPGNYDTFVSFAKSAHIHQMFCTASQSADVMRQRLPGVKVTWIPEGVCIDEIPCGPALVERRLDVLCYGRSMPNIQAAINEAVKCSGCSYSHDGGATFEDLTATVRNAKISICYPLCDTNPDKAQGVETLTQRYWEGMLSGTLMLGRAPRELVDLCGYNPVVDLGKDPVNGIVEAVRHIGDYQPLVDRNRKVAEEKGGWSARMPLAKEALGL